MKNYCVFFQQLNVYILYTCIVTAVLNAQSGAGDDSAAVVPPSKIFQSTEFVVYSTRIQSDLLHTPFPLDVSLHNDLKQQPRTTIADALKNSPGLSIVRDGTWETAVSIRGMSRSNIVTLIDNVRIETANDIAGALSLVNMHDLERVETVRSPGAALYGTGALGGVIHMMTKRTSFTEQLHMSGEVSSEISSVNDYTGHHLALETSSNAYAMRLSGGYRNAGSIMTPSGVLPNSQFKDFNLNTSVAVKTIGEQKLHLSYQRSQAEDAGIPGGPPIAASATATYTLAKRELFGVEYSVPDISSVVSQFTFRASRQNIVRNVEIVQTPTLTLTPHAIHSTTSAQVESRITAADNNFLVLGADIWQRGLESKREKINKMNNTVTGERPVPGSRFLSAGLFAQDEWYLLPEKLTLILGARYDRIRISNDETRNPEYLDTAGVRQTAPWNQKILWHNGTAWNNSWSANAGIQYSLFSHTELTFLASTAFRSPSLEERYQFLDLGNVVRVGDPYLKPERSIGVNAGIRFHTDKARIQADIFLNQLTDLVADIPGTFENRTAFIKHNIGEARLYGYEVSGEHHITGWSVVKYSASYVRGEESKNNTNLPGIAPFHGTVALNATFQDAGTISVSSSASSSQNNLAAGETRTGGYAVFDIDAATVPIAVERFSITARGGIQNIFDKAYRNHLSTLRGIVKLEPGRNFYLSFTVSV